MTKDLTLISATGPPKVTAVFELNITPAYGSRMNNMHGGAVALVFDMCTTMTVAPLSRKDFWWFGGVSRVLSITYLRPVKVGMCVRIECEVLQMGARLGRLKSTVFSKVGYSDEILSSNYSGRDERQSHWPAFVSR